MNHKMQGRSNHDESLTIAYWCFVSILVLLGVALVREGVLRLWPLIERWL